MSRAKGRRGNGIGAGAAGAGARGGPGSPDRVSGRVTSEKGMSRMMIDGISERHKRVGYSEPPPDWQNRPSRKKMDTAAVPQTPPAHEEFPAERIP